MRRQLNPILLLVCAVFLPGCMGGFPVATSSAKPVVHKTSYELVGQEIADTPRGSQVRVCLSNPDTCCTGTLFKGTADGVDLVNCFYREGVPGGPNGQLQLKTTHVLMQSFKTTSMTSFTVLAPPNANYVVPDISQDSSGADITEVIYRDGTRQRNNEAPVPAKPDERIDSTAKK